MGRPAKTDRQAVIRAGLALADEQGLASVTMQAVADRLGVTPMALYRHVANKADLLDGLVEELLTESLPPGPAEGPRPPSPPESEPAADDDTWNDRLTATATAVRAAAARHPSVFPLLLQRPATTPGALRVRQGIYEALTRAGVDPQQVPRTERLISTAILGYAASEAAGRFAQHSRRDRNADFTQLLDMLAQFIRGLWI